MYKYSSMDSFAHGSANDNDVTDENRYCRKEISTVKSQTGAESIPELNNQTMQSPGQWAFVRIGLDAVMQVGLSPSWGESPLDKAYSQDNSRQIGHHQMTSEGKCQKKICRTDFWDFGDFEEEKKLRRYKEDSQRNLNWIHVHPKLYWNFPILYFKICKSEKWDPKRNRDEQNTFPPSCCICDWE